MGIVIDFVYLLAAAVISPKIVYRMVRHNRYRSGWGQRFGKITRKNPAKKCIWLHAVSVGEVNAAKTVIEELENRFSNPRSESRTSFEIVISTTTDTGFARANALFGEKFQVCYFPFDFSWVTRRAFRNINPALCLLMELEVWPNFVETARKLNVPVVVVNGRISDKSFPAYKMAKPIVKKIFRKVCLVLAQTKEYAHRFKELGCPDERVVVTGSLKYDTAQITDKVQGTDELAGQLFDKTENRKSKIENRLWVAGGTGPGEEKIILNVFRNLRQDMRFGDLRLVIVPRKPERFNEVAELIKQAGFELIRYSQIKRLATVLGTPYGENTPLRPKGYAGQAECTEKSSIEHRVSSIESVILGDTMGDLRKFYSLATIIFVGRSLVLMGGSDMAEAAALGKCTMFGPHTFNFKQTVDALLADEGAIMVKDEQALLDAMRKCLADADYAERIARNGQEVIRKNQGATARTIEQIAQVLSTTRGDYF